MCRNTTQRLSSADTTGPLSKTRVHIKVKGNGKGSAARRITPGTNCTPKLATKFSLRVVDAQIGFDVDAAGNVVGPLLAQNGRRLPGLKKRQQQATRAPCRRRVGDE